MIVSDYSRISTNPAPKFNTLRKKLDQFGYDQPLCLESVELVERLFMDVLNKTDSLKQLKHNYSDKNDFCQRCELKNNEFKNEFENLIRENNDLHLNIMHSQEELQKNSIDFKTKLTVIENENTDLKLLLNQYVQKLKDLEKVSKEKSDCILQMQDKNFYAVVQTTSQSKQNKNQFRRPKLELNNFLTKSVGAKLKHNLLNNADDPKYIDAFKLIEDNLLESRGELRNLREKNTALEGRIGALTLQVENRNTEIERLCQLNNKQKSFKEKFDRDLLDHNKLVAVLQKKVESLLEEIDIKNGKILNFEKLESANTELEAKLNDNEQRLHQLTEMHDESIKKEADRYNLLLTESDRLKFLLLSKDQSLKELTKYKKEKSTDCDSALIPLLCVHG